MVVIHAIFFNFISLNIQAAELTVDVIDMTGLPVENAVVYAEPDNPVAMPEASATIEQRGKQFNPLVSVIQTGSDITFPNFDSVRHHVYSFSPAKTFELKLYSGVPTSPVKFDKAGTVVLGCNIHDTMVAFIQVVDTPYFTKSNKLGKALLRDLPNGGYTLKVWHYALAKDKEVVEKKLQVKESQPVVMQVSLKPFILPARK
ncbi:MAG: methylamine utilization protein [Proteobacteria bacterium ST_bin12]|nr:MAG: methylamine utilization protein [Proteobacteria bacterium ST_bin12]